MTCASDTRPGRQVPSAVPDWATYQPNSIWIYDSTHFATCGMTVLIIEDLVSRKWIAHARLRGGDPHPGPPRL